MTRQEKKRLQLVSELMGARIHASIAVSKYLATDREYTGGDILHMREAHLIVAIAPGMGKTMSELAEIMGVTIGAVSQIASRLEKKGYLCRQRSVENHRQIVATLTEKGEAFYHRHLDYDSAKFSLVDQNYLYRFTDDQLRALTEYENIICQIFTKKDTTM